MGVWKDFGQGFRDGFRSDSGEPTDASPPTQASTNRPPTKSSLDTPSLKTPAHDKKSARRRKVNKIVLSVLALFAVLLLVGLVIDAVNKEEVGKTDDPEAQATALGLLATIAVRGRAPKTGYSRAQFGRTWDDKVDVEGGHNDCDTRNDILRRDMTDVVADGPCRVLSGVLDDPYTGKQILFDREEGTDVLVQIDHVVALMDAWEKGAQQWDLVTRTEFANDPLNLLAVSGKANRMKKAGDVATWLPNNKDFRCAYVTRVVQVKAKYGVWMTDEEHDTAGRILQKCASEAGSISSTSEFSLVPPMPSTSSWFPPLPPPPSTSSWFPPPPPPPSTSSWFPPR